MSFVDNDFVTLQNAAVATGAGKWLACDGAIGGAVAIQIDGITTATVTFQATVDGINVHSVQAENLATGDFSTTATADNIFRIETAGLGAVRANLTAWTSGTITIIGRNQAG